MPTAARSDDIGWMVGREPGSSRGGEFVLAQPSWRSTQAPGLAWLPASLSLAPPRHNRRGGRDGLYWLCIGVLLASMVLSSHGTGATL
jgi:hypothetical protein